MAHESFEDAEVAAVMNRLYVNIKVHRVERSDNDQIYMAALPDTSRSFRQRIERGPAGLPIHTPDNGSLFRHGRATAHPWPAPLGHCRRNA